MKWILLLLPFLLGCGCRTVLVFGFHKEMALETSHNPWQPDSSVDAEIRIERDWE